MQMMAERRPTHTLPQLYSLEQAIDFVQDSNKFFAVVNLNGDYVTVVSISPEEASKLLIIADRKGIDQVALGFSRDPGAIYIGQ